MRRLEYALLFAAAFAVFWPVVFGIRPRRGIVALTLSVALFAQLQFEGYRWQMIPLYLAVVGLAIGDIFFLERRFEWSRRVFRGLLGAVGLGLGLAVPVILPVPELPPPGGPEAIGTITVQLIDRERDEPYGERPGGPREFMAQIWYPAQPDETAEPTQWTEDRAVVVPAVSRQLGFPSWFWSQTRFSPSSSMPSAAIADGTFPVIIYSHNWGATRSTAVNQIEHLVSNGYIVIGVDHAYSAAATVFEDGDVAYLDPGALPEPDTIEADDFQEAAVQLVATHAGDVITVLNRLDQGEEGPFAAIADSADLNLVGVYGHGVGGAAAIKVCLEDERCDAVLAMDPWADALTERDLQQDMARPALYMRSEEWVGRKDDALLAGIAARGHSVTYTLGIEGAATSDFVMVPLLSPLAGRFGMKGPIPAGRVIPIVDNYLLGFFDVFLLGTGPAALDSVSFDEVDVSVFDARE